MLNLREWGFVIPVGLEIFLITLSRYFLVPYRRTANCVGCPVHQAVSVHLQELYNHAQVPHASYHATQYSLGIESVVKWLTKLFVTYNFKTCPPVCVFNKVSVNYFTFICECVQFHFINIFDLMSTFRI
jgi:hypothetical protein